jgi:hypothetical protein
LRPGQLALVGGVVREEQKVGLIEALALLQSLCLKAVEVLVLWDRPKESQVTGSVDVESHLGQNL